MNRRQFVAGSGVAALGAWPIVRGFAPAATDRRCLAVIVGAREAGETLQRVWSETAGIEAGRVVAFRPGQCDDALGEIDRVRPALLGVAATRPSPELLVRAAERGVRAVYWESPWFAGPGELAALAQAAAEHQLAVALGSSPCYWAALPLARQLLRSGAAGSVLEIRVTGELPDRGATFWAASQRCLALTMAVGALPSSAVCRLYFAGRAPAQGQASQWLAGQDQGPVAFHAACRAPNGTVAHVDLASAATRDVCHLTVEGDRGAFRIDLQRPKSAEFRAGLAGSFRRMSDGWSLVPHAFPGIRIPESLPAAAAAAKDLIASLESGSNRPMEVRELRLAAEILQGVA